MRYLTWAWLIIIGYIMITPLGPICIACGQPISKTTLMVLGGISILLGIAGFATGRAQAANKAVGGR